MRKFVRFARRLAVLALAVALLCGSALASGYGAKVLVPSMTVYGNSDGSAVALGALKLALSGRQNVPDRVAQPPAEATALNEMDAVYAAKDDPCFHLERGCDARRGALVELKLITALEFEKALCPVCGANVRLPDGT